MSAKNVTQGKRLERRLANLLTEWTGTLFRRRRIESNEMATICHDLTADLVPMSGRSYFSIEVKSGDGFSLDSLMKSPKICKFTAWLHQTMYGVSQLKKAFGTDAFYPMLMFKPDPAWDWLAVSVDAFKTILKDRAGEQAWPVKAPHLVFDEYDRLGEISMNVKHTKKKANFLYVPLQLPAVVIMRWLDFTSYIDPKSIFSIAPTASPEATSSTSQP